MSGLARSAWNDSYQELHRTLVAAQGRRDALRGYIGGEAEWVTYERDEMFRAVNTIRDLRGLGHVLMAQIRAAENQACGHIDYTKKFALHCADLTTEATP